MTLSKIKEMVKNEPFLKERFEKHGIDIGDILKELEFEVDDDLIKRKLDMSFSPKDFTIYFSPKFLDTNDEEFITTRLFIKPVPGDNGKFAISILLTSKAASNK